MSDQPRTLWKVITASSAGTLIEWYDFYIFGSLAVTISEVFFPKGSGATALLSTLATFAIGFVVRPFGAMFFGFLGDRIGRKYTFMVTLLLMGGATFLIGILPGFATIGWAAPILLVVLRLLQGLALGGEYGGAATYVAEHAPDGRRGFWTSWIQTTATLGLFVSLAVILACRSAMTPAEFTEWGWRIPFWVSLVLVIFSYYIRRRMSESPLFVRAKAAGKISRNPFKESFGNSANLKIVLIALFGATAGQGVIWYTGQFYAMYFIKTVIGVEARQAEYIIGIALLLGTPFFIVFGAFSDLVGRKKIILCGCLLGLICYYPIYTAMMRATDVFSAQRFHLVNTEQAAPPKIEKLPATADVPERTVTTLTERHTYHNGTVRTSVVTKTEAGPVAAPDIGGQRSLGSVQAKHTIRFASLSSGPALALIGLVWVQVLFVTMVYGPIAAFLVELFPTRIRYSSMSLPYHIGNGVFGGMVPFIGTMMVNETGNKLAGLWYPMVIAAMTVIIGMIFIRENRNVKMWDEEQSVG